MLDLTSIRECASANDMGVSVPGILGMPNGQRAMIVPHLQGYNVMINAEQD